MGKISLNEPRLRGMVTTLGFIEGLWENWRIFEACFEVSMLLEKLFILADASALQQEHHFAAVNVENGHAWQSDNNTSWYRYWVMDDKGPMK